MIRHIIKYFPLPSVPPLYGVNLAGNKPEKNPGITTKVHKVIPWKYLKKSGKESSKVSLNGFLIIKKNIEEIPEEIPGGINAGIPVGTLGNGH